jgi:hypothetical protein
LGQAALASGIRFTERRPYGTLQATAFFAVRAEVQQSHMLTQHGLLVTTRNGRVAIDS